MINYYTEKVFKKSNYEFCFNRCFRESSLRNLQRELSIAFYPDSYVFMCFEIAQVYLRSMSYRVCSLAKRMSHKPFSETSKKLQICLH